MYKYPHTAELFVSILIYLKLEFLTQLTASNDENCVIYQHLPQTILTSSVTFRPLGYERVYPRLRQVVNTPFISMGTILFGLKLASAGSGSEGSMLILRDTGLRGQGVTGFNVSSFFTGPYPCKAINKIQWKASKAWVCFWCFLIMVRF